MCLKGNSTLLKRELNSISWQKTACRFSCTLFSTGYWSFLQSVTSICQHSEADEGLSNINQEVHEAELKRWKDPNDKRLLWLIKSSWRKKNSSLKTLIYKLSHSYSLSLWSGLTFLESFDKNRPLKWLPPWDICKNVFYQITTN